MGSVQIPSQPWSQIDGNLWIGGLHYDLGDGRSGDARVTYEFAYVVSMHYPRGFGPAAGIPHLRCLIDDAPLIAETLALVKSHVGPVVRELDAGRKVLIRCQAGLNRSALLAALVLIARGRSATEAIELIRAARSPHALHNPDFVACIEREYALTHPGRVLAGESR